jgi:outer membrane protein assembly factor BamA
MHYTLNRVEYVYDNTISKTLNIWNGLRYKIYTDINSRLVNTRNSGKFMFNIGGDLRYYLPIYRNFIWAGRAAADFSFGTEKIIYYLGGTDGWINPKFNDANRPDNDIDYAFQTLSGNLRGYKQNIANGNNTIVINSEFRLPLFATISNRPINNAFIRNFQLIQFFDLGSAWNGKFDNLKRPYIIYGNPPLQVRVKTGGVGPLIGGYGFGARSTLLGYFLRVDAGWPMGGFFVGKPLWYFSLGVDF